MKFRWFFATLGLSLLFPVSVPAQTKPFEILDNSFLVEEAFNQERGVVQNIFSWTRSNTGEWGASFTQEWPVPTVTHQFSYTVPWTGGDGASAHVGGVLLNYRFQAFGEGPGRAAFAPRLSVVLPSASDEDASDRPGLQVNLPFSKQVGDLYLHWNAGVIWLHGVPRGLDDATNLTSPQVSASVIWNMRPLLNPMFEMIVVFDEAVDAHLSTSRERTVIWCPGLRGGWNLGETQLIVGGALPVTVRDDERTVALLTYLSLELPFTKKR